MRRVVLDRLSVGGLGVVAAMHLLFVLTGLADPSPSMALSGIGFVGAIVCAWGLWAAPARPPLGALAGGIALLLGVRATYLFRGLGDVGLDDLGGFLAVGGFLLALVHAVLWAIRPTHGAAARMAGLRLGLGITAAGYFASMVTVISSGSLTTMLGLLLGAVGFSLAAPNVHEARNAVGAVEKVDAQRA